MTEVARVAEDGLMTVVVGVLLLLATANPPRHAGTAPGRAPWPATAVAVGALALLAVVADPLLDALDITTPTWRMTVGIVVAIAGARDLLRGTATPIEDGGNLVVPLAFPVLLRPEVAFAVVIVALDASLGAAIVGGALAVGLGAWAATRPVSNSAVTAGGARVLGAVAIALGLDLIVDGVLAV
jgi:small neutral amino acid transporter SnatA (MarC family)